MPGHYVPAVPVHDRHQVEESPGHGQVGDVGGPKMSMSQEPIYVGIDMAKDQVDVAVRPTGCSWTVQYDEAGVDGLVARLNSLKPVAVITESTGGLELALVAALAAASLPVAVAVQDKCQGK